MQASVSTRVLQDQEICINILHILMSKKTQNPPPKKRSHKRHNPISIWLHLLAVWMVICAIAIATSGHWAIASALPLAGYCLHLIGHAIEGSPLEETLILRRILKFKSKNGGNESEPKRKPRIQTRGK